MTIQECLAILNAKTIENYIRDDMQMAYADEQLPAYEVISAACEVACNVLMERLQNDTPSTKVNFCAGCVNEYDPACLCHGGKGYVAR